MKKAVLISLVMLLILMLILSCSSDKKTNPDTEAPSVTITYPPNNSSFTSGTAINIVAEAEDNEEVDNVKFYIDGVNLYEDTSEPYMYNWDTIGLNGAHTIYAKATDSSENTTTSDIITVTITDEGEAPNPPSNPNPQSGAINVTTNTTLSWTCTDPNGDQLTYDMYFGTNVNPSLVSSDLTINNYNPGTLDETTTYYWYIKATDTDENSTTGPLWSFTTLTSGGGNHAPNPPTNPNPADNATDVSIDTNLSWTCTDPDGDPLTYDIYFGTLSNPSIIVSGQSETTYDPGTLNEGTTYYWKIVASDGQIETNGSIWEFTSFLNTNQPPNAPTNPTPENETISISILTDLTWYCSDPDEDSLTYDVYFGTDSTPDIGELVSNEQSSTIFDLDELEYETTYYWKIVASDGQDETEGNVWQFTTMNGGYGSVTDIDGNIYQTLVIGDQEWMTENLKVTHYRNGDTIPNVTDNSDWASLSTGAYCVYDNDPSNAETYGNLYNWYAVNTGMLAPEGWHVPTDEDIIGLEIYLGIPEIEAYEMDWRGTNEGSKLAGNADLWADGELENNSEFGSSGFNALPGGSRNGSNGDYYYINYSFYFLSSTQHDYSNAKMRLIVDNYTTINRSFQNMRYGSTIRCIKD